ncbi:MAG: leucine-rich repeat domain-containing protein [Clostridia bacterium]|nr:leucine-rich repeat domain-containing protein [Clostridia bacterium]
MNNKTKQIIVVVAVFVLALASLGTVIGLIVNTGRLSEYSGGFSYTLNGSRATITGYDGDEKEVVVPDRVRGNRVVAIAKGAFSSKASAIEKITVKTTSSAFSLENEAFKDMTALKTVVLPDGLKVIPEGAFSGCKALTRVIIPDSVTNIGDKAFYDCTSLIFAYNSEEYSTDGENAIDEEIFYMPSGLLEIGANAFENCTALIGAYFNKALEKVGNEAFYKATAFTELTLEEDCEVATIGNNAFQNTKLRSNSSYPLEFKHLVNIGDKDFANITSNFTQFKFPATVKSVGANAFMSTTSLSTVEFEDGSVLETFGEGVFQDCTYLSSIVLPESIKSIPAKAFMGCTRLLYSKDFVIGKNVEEIGEGAFAIYTNNATYSRYSIEVNSENEYFAITELQEFKKSSSSNTYDHGLLTNADGSVVYAYFGSYDKTSSNSGGSAFRFNDINGNQIDTITHIKSYAFAGVAFEDMRLPKTVKTLGEYLFYESEDFLTTYIESVEWEWAKTSFNKKTDGSPEVEVMILISVNATESEKSDFESALAADGIYVGWASSVD